MSEWKETSLGNIPIDWDINSLGELLYIKGRIGWKGLKKSEYLKEGYAIINGEQIINGKVDWKNVGRIPKERYDESPEIMLKSGDILMTKDGTIGKIALIENLPEHATVASGVFVIRKQSPRLKQKYLYYFFKSHYFNYLIKSRTEGSVIPHLYQRDFIEMEIPLPEPNEQENISKLLTKLDNKIDLLRRQNETLEAIAQTLFKRWFVDFEFPNKEGQPYKSSGGKMVSSELGEIPEGWRVGLSGDIIFLQGGFAFKSKAFKKVGNHGIIKIKNIQNQIVDILNTDFVDDEIVQNLDEKFRIKPGDVLIAMTGAEVAKVGVVPQNDSNLWLNQRVGLFKNKINKRFLFIYYLFSKPEYQKALRDKGTGSSAQPNISATDIESIRILVPDVNILYEFAKLANPMFNKVVSNLHQIQILDKIRDTLLPKLMSGQIRVKEN